jgi:hypothetical protein
MAGLGAATLAEHPIVYVPRESWKASIAGDQFLTGKLIAPGSTEAGYGTITAANLACHLGRIAFRELSGFSNSRA